MSDEKKLKKVEFELLLEAIYKHYGYDFRDYATASLKRRIDHNLMITKSKTYAELLEKIINDPSAFEELLKDLSITVTEMFRDPEIYKAIRHYILPTLKTYPFIKIWHAGCATGEEVYSMAILLYEEGLLEKTQIYATDINNIALEKAKEGIYPSENMKKYAKNYLAAGGKKSFSDYYLAKYGYAKMHDFLKSRITFAYHNLAVDQSFCEAQLIVCRNVLIYFNRDLQNRALNLLDESLCRGGFLFLGSKESISFSDIHQKYDAVLMREKLYQKRYFERKDDRKTEHN